MSTAAQLLTCPPGAPIGAAAARHGGAHARHEPVRCACLGSFRRRKADGAWLLAGSRLRYLKHIAPILTTIVNRHFLPADGDFTALIATPAEVVGLAVAAAGGALPAEVGGKQ